MRTWSKSEARVDVPPMPELVAEPGRMAERWFERRRPLPSWAHEHHSFERIVPGEHRQMALELFKCPLIGEDSEGR